MEVTSKEKSWTLEKWIDLLKQVALFGGLITGTGFAILYFFGIAIYATYTSMLGIPPFDFNMQNCLEYGGSSVVTLSTILPWLLMVGIVDNLKEAGVGQYISFTLPLFLFIILRFLKKHPFKWNARIQALIQWGLLLYLGLFLITMYLTFLSMYQTRNLFMNPGVTVVLENREALLKKLDFTKPGLEHMDAWTANIAIHDENWVAGKIGAMYSMAGLLLLYALFAIRSSHQYLVNSTKNKGRPKGFVYLRRGFMVIFTIFILGALFIVPARTVSMLSLSLPKVDASIQQLEYLTSKYYLVLAGDYENRYAFYLPHKQNVIFISKDKVNHITLMEPVSIFADRNVFRKTPEAK